MFKNKYDLVVLVFTLITVKAESQVLGFEANRVSKWNVNAGILNSTVSFSNSTASEEASTLTQMGLGYAFRLSAGTEMHFAAKAAMGGSQIYNLDEHILFNLDATSSDALKIGLGLHYLGFEPVYDQPGFRNLGGFGLALMYESSFFGGNFEAGLYKNSESQGFARKIQVGLFLKLLQIDNGSKLFLQSEYYQLNYKFNDLDSTEDFSGYNISVVYTFR